jgi:hypothetical protein
MQIGVTKALLKRVRVSLSTHLLSDMKEIRYKKSSDFFLSNATKCPYGLRGVPSWAWQSSENVVL